MCNVEVGYLREGLSEVNAVFLILDVLKSLNWNKNLGCSIFKIPVSRMLSLENDALHP